MNIASYEYVVSRSPFVVRRKVRWSDCDPAGVVFTGKFVEYVLNFASLFYAELAQGAKPMEWLHSLGVVMPVKGMEFEFHGALWPEDEFDLSGHVLEIREHSFDIAIEGAQADGRRVMSARFSPICIRSDARVRAPIPPQLLQALERFRPPKTSLNSGSPL